MPMAPGKAMGIAGFVALLASVALVTVIKLQATTIELGHASDTTLARVSAGLMSVEGGNVPLENRANTFSADQTLTGGANALTVGTPTADTTSEGLIEASAATQTPLGLEGATSQTANLLEIKEQGGAVINGVGPLGLPISESYHWVVDHLWDANQTATGRTFTELYITGTAGGTSSSITWTRVTNGAMGAHTQVTGTDTTGYSNSYTNRGDVVEFGTVALVGAVRFRLEDLSDVTDTYTFRAGFSDATATSVGDGTDGVFVRYIHSANSGKFVFVSRSNSSETTSDTGVTVAADTWYTVVFLVNAAANSATCMINNAMSSGGAHALTIPTGSARVCGMASQIVKSAGTTSRTAYTDYFAIGWRQ